MMRGSSPEFESDNFKEMKKCQKLLKLVFNIK